MKGCLDAIDSQELTTADQAKEIAKTRNAVADAQRRRLEDVESAEKKAARREAALLSQNEVREGVVTKQACCMVTHITA